MSYAELKTSPFMRTGFEIPYPGFRSLPFCTERIRVVSGWFCLKADGWLCAALVLTLTNGFAQQPGTVLWSLPFGADYSSPAIGADGTLYLCSWRNLFSISPAGISNWSFSATDVCYSSPAVDRDGTIYFGSSDDHLYALNPHGSKKWDFQAGDAIMSSPALAANGTIYFGSRDRKVYALNPNGTKKWDFVAGDIQRSSPAVARDGTIYIGTMENRLYALRSDGTKKWEFDAGAPISSSPAIAADGTIYCTVGVFDGGPVGGATLFALSPDGVELWRKGGLTTSPVLGKDGTIYIGAPASLNAINPTHGTVIWTRGGGFPFRSYLPCTPAVADNGLVYWGSWATYQPTYFFAINPDGTTNWVFPTMSVTGSPTVGPDGTVYFTTATTLYALRGTAPLASSPWPKYRQNLRNTGKVERPELRNPRLTASGFDCSLLGEIGQSYWIQASTDLLDWSVLTNCMSSNMPVPFVDAAATNFPSRFYRAATP